MVRRVNGTAAGFRAFACTGSARFKFHLVGDELLRYKVYVSSGEKLVTFPHELSSPSSIAYSNHHEPSRVRQDLDRAASCDLRRKQT